MIEELQIRNLGVIDNTQIEFSPGFTVLTGETGAGKTMILTSLRLLMGEKGESTIVRAGTTRAEIDGVFTLPRDLSFDLETEDDQLIIWRTVPAEGRSRGAIGGRPAPLSTLSEVTRSLVTIHGQSDQWTLRGEGAQRSVLDRYAGHQQLLDDYESAWAEAVAAKRRLDEVREDFDKIQVEIGYLEETTTAIALLNPAPGEEDSLDADIDRLSSVEELRTHFQSAREALAADANVMDLVGKAVTELRRAARLDRTVDHLVERVDGLAVEVEDVLSEIDSYAANLNEDPQELETLLARRATLETLLRGRGQTVQELLEWNERALERLRELTDDASDPAELEKRLHSAQAQVLAAGTKLHESRTRAAVSLAQAVNRELHGLAMAEADFRIEVREDAPASHGLDKVEMQLRSHKSGPHLPLAKGSSGGELSRVMLALEVALGEKSADSTYIFDEVDAGIGGRVAIEVGKRLARLARTQQVIAVTHLPQVAAKADRHLVVQKTGGTATVTSVEDDQRIEELVRMMGGDPQSSAARRHASELISA